MSKQGELPAAAGLSNKLDIKNKDRVPTNCACADQHTDTNAKVKRCFMLIGSQRHAP